MSTQVRSPLKYSGGKAAAAGRILSAFPPPHTYSTYVEPCGGAAHVLFAKPTWGHAEVYGDLSNNLYTFFNELRDNADELQQKIDTLLYARAQYYDFYPTLFDGTPLTSLDRAIRFYTCLRMTGTGWLRKSPPGWSNQHSNVLSFRSATELFPIMQERLKYVAIDNRDCLDTIRRYDSPKTLLYLDPPYINAEHYYEASRYGFDHQALARALNQAKSFVALSYYPHPDLDQLYPASKWRRMTWQQKKNCALHENAENDVATELLLMNYPETFGGLFDGGINL